MRQTEVGYEFCCTASGKRKINNKCWNIIYLCVELGRKGRLQGFADAENGIRRVNAAGRAQQLRGWMRVCRGSRLYGLKKRRPEARGLNALQYHFCSRDANHVTCRFADQLRLLNCDKRAYVSFCMRFCNLSRAEGFDEFYQFSSKSKQVEKATRVPLKCFSNQSGNLACEMRFCFEETQLRAQLKR